MRMMVFTPRTERRAQARAGDDSVIYVYKLNEDDGFYAQNRKTRVGARRR